MIYYSRLVLSIIRVGIHYLVTVLKEISLFGICFIGSLNFGARMRGVNCSKDS